jgi:large-conductance mechanosensitive channel
MLESGVTMDRLFTLSYLITALAVFLVINVFNPTNNASSNTEKPELTLVNQEFAKIKN